MKIALEMTTGASPAVNEVAAALSQLLPEIMGPDCRVERLGDLMESAFGQSGGNQFPAESLYHAGCSDVEATAGHPDILHVGSCFCPMIIRKAKIIMTLDGASAGLQSPPALTSAAGRQVAAERQVAAFTGLFNAAVFGGDFICLDEAAAAGLAELFPHVARSRIHPLPAGDKLVRAHAIADLYRQLLL